MSNFIGEQAQKELDEIAEAVRKSIIEAAFFYTVGRRHEAVHKSGTEFDIPTSLPARDVRRVKPMAIHAIRKVVDKCCDESMAEVSHAAKVSIRAA